jgi:hypothetical protein
MSNSVFAHLSFWLVLALSVGVPSCIYVIMLAKRAISLRTVVSLGFALVTIAGLDVYFLRTLAAASALTPSLADDAIFLSEVSTALYLFPAMIGGIGVNVLSHVLVRHLMESEARFEGEHPAHRMHR